MKSYSKYLLAGAVAATLSGCADYIDTNNFVVEKPQSLADYAYLNDYGTLKSYIDRAAYPNFKLGVALAVDDYLKYGSIYALANANFDIMTAGNAMKNASIVSDKGSMNFYNVEQFVDAASNAGIEIYGHTLAWHEQQAYKYYNSLLADKVDPDYVPGEKVEQTITENRTCLRIPSAAMQANAWDNQFWLVFPGTSFAEGDSWEVSMSVRADLEASVGTQVHAAPGNYLHWAAIGSVKFTPEWSTYTASGTIEASQVGGYSIAFNLNDFADANIYYFDDLSFKLNGQELIVNGSCDDLANSTCFAYKYDCGAIVDAPIVDSFSYTIMAEPEGEVEKEIMRNCIEVDVTEKVSEAWDNQFWFLFPGASFNEGDTWEISMEVRASEEASISTQIHQDPGAYLYWSAIGNVKFTTDWTEFTASGTFNASQAGGYSIAFNLNDYAPANKYYFDNISFKLNGQELIVNGDCEDPTNTTNYVSKEKGTGSIQPARIVDRYIALVPGNAGLIPLTPEEKKEILTAELEKWVKGMMEATKGYVKMWDLVNEAIAGGGDDGEGFYPLQTMNPDTDQNKFYWQDYLGSIDYVTTMERLARQYYAGNPEDLKLFINDYNLESWWDGNKKLKSLIHWIEKWEANGAKIDGIGSQMHVSYILNPEDQKTQEAAIENMFKLMAKTGKLVRITELDMSIVDKAFGTDIPTADVTVEQHMAMAEFYKWIVKKYLEIIPVNQQSGITQWCITDSPSNSGWRADCAVGLWNSEYQRKPAYGGFADGLQGK